MASPNVLLIFTDQQRYDTIHAWGNPIIQTPNLDRLVNEGVLFENVYTPSPVCVPARCSMIYGQYPHNTGCTFNGDPMPEDRPSMMDLLSDAGYRTHGIGKMHFKPDRMAMRGFQSREHSEENPRRIEEDDYLQFLIASGYRHVHDTMGPRSELYYIPQPAQMPARLHNTHWVGDRSVEFIRTCDRSRPFFLFSSFIHPHPPFSPPTPWNKLYRAALMPLPKCPKDYETLQTYINKIQNRYKYRDNGTDYNLLRAMRAYYYACISFVDFQVGRMLAALEETDQLDNTLFLFTSDHGEFLGDYGCFGKRSMLDCAAKIPLVVRYPARFGQGQVCESMASLVDVMPTVLSAAGIDWQRGNYRPDGMDLAELAAGDQDSTYLDRTVYSQYNRGQLGIYMAVSQRWKYFYSAPDHREFLFDRVRDPWEERNCQGLESCTHSREQMRIGLLGFYRSQGYNDPMDGDGWRLFAPPPPPKPADPDLGLLSQDAGWCASEQDLPGYTVQYIEPSRSKSLISRVDLCWRGGS